MLRIDLWERRVEQEFQLEDYSNDFELEVTLKNHYFNNFSKILYRSEKIGIMNSQTQLQH